MPRNPRMAIGVLYDSGSNAISVIDGLSTRRLTKARTAARDAWLRRAADAIRARFSEMGVEVPPDVHVSCGWRTGGLSRRRIGECWPRGRSPKAVNLVFISPLLGKVRDILDTLGHELLHAADDCRSGHGRVFAENARLVGYTIGKHARATSVARAWLAQIAIDLGPYPELSPLSSTLRPRSRRTLVEKK